MREKLNNRENKLKDCYCTAGAFGLVELIISLGLLSIAIVGTLQAIQFANILSIEARETTIAINDARSILEQIKVTPIASLPANQTVNAGTIWPTLNTFVSNSLTSELIQITGGAGNSLRQITVTVSWTGPRNKQKNVIVTTQKSFFNG